MSAATASYLRSKRKRTPEGQTCPSGQERIRSPERVSLSLHRIASDSATTPGPAQGRAQTTLLLHAEQLGVRCCLVLLVLLFVAQRSLGSGGCQRQILRCCCLFD